MGTYDLTESTYFETWPDLRTQLLNDATPSFAWRGVANAEWCLHTSLERFMMANRVKDRSRLERRLLDLYGGDLRELGLASIGPDSYSDEELWALGQHWGLPTPLLDWSHSPMVALYFAMTSLDSSPESGERVACIWRLNYTASHLKDGDVRRAHFQPGPWNARLRAQQGVFTLSQANGCVVDLLYERGYAADLYAYTFPAALRSNILHDLALMTIDDLRLFPDQYGVVRHVRSQAIVFEA